MMNKSEFLVPVSITHPASLSEAQSLLERFARALGGSIVKKRTPDGWDWHLHIMLSGKITYCSYGFYIAETYDKLLKEVMASNGWAA